MLRTGNGKCNRRSFDCTVRKCASRFAQDDSYMGWVRVSSMTSSEVVTGEGVAG